MAKKSKSLLQSNKEYIIAMSVTVTLMLVATLVFTLLFVKTKPTFEGGRMLEYRDQ